MVEDCQGYVNASKIYNNEKPFDSAVLCTLYMLYLADGRGAVIPGSVRRAEKRNTVQFPVTKTVLFG